MILKVTEQNEIFIAKFVDVSRFTLPICDEVKAELRPLLSEQGRKLIFDLHDIDFIDSSGIGCIITLFKTAKRAGSTLTLCNLTPDVLDIFNLLHLQVIFNITSTQEGCLQKI
ncbi:MAG: STAS domain-containing protein [Odoribacteraceae bacterium]|nr:STAS domain-containing protein [Odoribacteraceae bacterium]